jgi:hypothetical protein
MGDVIEYKQLLSIKPIRSSTLFGNIYMEEKPPGLGFKLFPLSFYQKNDYKYKSFTVKVWNRWG